ncbi:lamin tail domain-containing protein [Chloroflexota bacterium]
MSKKIKISIAILIAISSFTVLVVLANEVANDIYMPVIYRNYGEPTATPIPEVVITGFHPSEIPQDDYVILKNNTGGTLDLTGWWLKAENQSGRYDFPVSFMLGSGASVNVVSGVGSDSATDLFIGLPFSLWTVANNCVYVRDINGDLQDQQCVGETPTPTETPTSSVYISGFSPSSNPPDDYVTIFNSTTESFNLIGWWMKAESESGRYDFPTDFILYAGGSVNVRSGIGTDTTTDLYIGGSYSLWTSASNCAYLRYSDGTLLDKKCVN